MKDKPIKVNYPVFDIDCEDVKNRYDRFVAAATELANAIKDLKDI